MTSQQGENSDKIAGKTAIAEQSLERTRLRRSGRGYAVMGSAMAYGSSARGEGLFGKLSRGAFWFCIWFAMIAPVLLFWRVVL